MAEKSVIKVVIPALKEYSKGRGVHKNQLFPSGASGMRGNAVGALVGPKGKIHYYDAQYSYCWAAFSRMDNSLEKASAIFVQLQPVPEDMNKEAYRHFVEWVINYSPWRHVFISKNINRVMREGVVVLDPNNKANTLISAMIAVRQAWENLNGNRRYRLVDMWWELAQKVDPKIALAVTDGHFSLKNLNERLTIKTTGSPMGHACLPFNGQYLTGFVNERNLDDSDTWNKIRTYDTPFTFWERDEKDFNTLFNSVVEKIGEWEKSYDGWSASTFLKVDRVKLKDAFLSEIPNMAKELYHA